MKALQVNKCDDCGAYSDDLEDGVCISCEDDRKKMFRGYEEAESQDAYYNFLIEQAEEDYESYDDSHWDTDWHPNDDEEPDPRDDIEMDIDPISYGPHW